MRGVNSAQKVITVDGPPATTSYDYNALNQLTSDGVNTFTYDDNGNLTGDGVNTYTWDRANRLTQVSDGVDTYAHTYDGMGRRVEQSVDGAATKYLLDAQPELWQVLAATTGQDTTRYLHGPLGLQSQEQSGGDWAFPVVDALGSVRGVADADLQPLESRLYAPYGEAFGTTGTSQTAFGFTGEPVDESGLLYLRARYYNAGVGRFFRMDPSWQEQNLYQYGLNNPVKYVDPTGEQANPCWLSDLLCKLLVNFPGFKGCPCPPLGHVPPVGGTTPATGTPRPAETPTDTCTPTGIPDTPTPSPTDTPSPPNPVDYCIPRGERICLDLEIATDQDILAHVLVAEASILDNDGMENVAQVILNRVDHPDFPRDPISVATASTETPASRNDFAFAGIADPAEHSGTFWNYGRDLANYILNGTNPIPGAHEAVSQNSEDYYLSVVYYCATSREVAADAQKVHIDVNEVLGIYQIYRTYEMGPCH